VTDADCRLAASNAHETPSGWALGALSVGQVVGWGILYYAPIVAAPAIAQDTGWTLPLTMAAISAGLVVSALSGILVGRLIDLWSPRAVMSWGPIVGTAGLLGAAYAQSLPWFFAAWLVVGIAQSAMLYQASFAVITRRYGARRYGALTILTLAGGLSSTVFAPITAALLAVFEWRDSLVILAGVLLVVTLPLHWFTVEKRWASEAKRDDPPIRYNVSAVIRTRQFWMLTVAMALLTLSLFSVTLAMIPLLMEKGVNYGTAALALGLVGAGQVVGRLLFFVAPHGGRTWVPIAVVAAASVVLLAGIGLVPGPLWLLIALAVLAGAVRGSHTLIQASAVADRWGTQNYGVINGAFSAPITVLMALSPALGPIIATGLGSYSVMALAMGALGLVALVLAPRS
jgi:MFS family permease